MGEGGTPSQAGGGYYLLRQGVLPSQAGGTTFPGGGEGTPFPGREGGITFPGGGGYYLPRQGVLPSQTGGYYLPRQGVLPSQVGGTTFPGRGYPLPEQHSVYLLRGGRYASCVHAGGLVSEYIFVDILRRTGVDQR